MVFFLCEKKSMVNVVKVNKNEVCLLVFVLVLMMGIWLILVYWGGGFFVFVM